MSENKPKPRVGRLDSIGAVITEMGKVYRAARRSNLDTIDGARLMAMLTQIRSALELGELEQRLAALEEQNHAPYVTSAHRAFGKAAPH